jgi:hypothetical protein
MQMRKIRLFVGMMGLTTLLACGVAYAGTKQQTGTVSGTAIDVPIDPDSDSCFPAPNGATVCTDYSSYGNFAGKITGGSDFTGQDNNENDPVAGTGCNIGGNVVPGIASCTLAGGNEQGCAFESVSEAQVVRDNSSGDLLFLTGSAFTLCTDLSSGPPFNFTGSFNLAITGGTGKNTGATGTRNGTLHGQTLTSDAAGHGLAWFEGNFTGTIMTP